MTLDGIIKKYEMWANDDRIDASLRKEHRQLAEWLKELKQLREQTRWIPVSERLPEESEE